MNEGDSLASFAQFKALAARKDGGAFHLGWFHKVMKNRWHERARAVQRVGLVSVFSKEGREDLASELATPEEQAMQREAAEDVLTAISAISARRRKIVELKYFRGLDHAAIAAELGVSLATVERDHKVALDTLGRRLTDHDTSFRSSVAWLLGGSQASSLPRGGANTATGVWASKVLLALALALVSVCVYFLISLVPSGSPGNTATIERIVPALYTEVGPGGLSEESILAPVNEREAVALDTVPEVAPPSEELSLIPGILGLASDKETDSKTGTNQFTLILEIDGKPAAQGWRSFVPSADPNGADARHQDPILCEDFNRTSDEGIFTYQLPKAAGSWLFQYPNDETWSGIWVIDSGADPEPRKIKMATTSMTLLDPGVDKKKGLTRDNLVMVGNPEPGVWMVSGALTVDEKTGAWTYARVPVGSVRLMKSIGDFDPDSWPLIGGPWQVSPDGTTTVR